MLPNWDPSRWCAPRGSLIRWTLGALIRMFGKHLDACCWDIHLSQSWCFGYWLYHPLTGHSIVCDRILMFNSAPDAELQTTDIGRDEKQSRSTAYFQNATLKRWTSLLVTGTRQSPGHPSSPLAGGAFRCTQTAWRATASGLNTHWTPPRWRFLAPRGYMFLGCSWKTWMPHSARPSQ